MANSSFYEIPINDINGNSYNLNTLKGKYILLVNVASECGYTPQYVELQGLHEALEDKVQVIGVPCNDFGGQEPGTSEEIVTFCQKNFGVSFQMLEKVEILEDPHPLYQWLTQKSKNGIDDYEVKWNFHKFLIDPQGVLVGSYPSGVSPMSDEILNLIR